MQIPALRQHQHPELKACARLRLGGRLRRRIGDHWARKRSQTQATGRRNGRVLCDGARWSGWRDRPRPRTIADCRGDLGRCGRCSGGGRRARYAICYCELVSFWAVDLRMARGKAHLTRSKIETRLPTGDSRQVPSGVKRRLPRLYTVPSRFENCFQVSDGRSGTGGGLAHPKVGLHGCADLSIAGSKLFGVAAAEGLGGQAGGDPSACASVAQRAFPQGLSLAEGEPRLRGFHHCSPLSPTQRRPIDVRPSSNSVRSLHQRPRPPRPRSLHCELCLLRGSLAHPAHARRSSVLFSYHCLRQRASPHEMAESASPIGIANVS